MTNNYAAATALATALPIDGKLSVTKTEFPVDASSAVTATLVGNTSADLAIVLAEAADVQNVTEGQTVIGLADVLYPALVAAGESLATGVLGEPSIGDAGPLFSDQESDVYEITDTKKKAVGWFAVRTRSVNKAAALPLNEVAGKLSRISQVEMSLTVEIGHTRMSVRDVLAVEPGAVIELDRSAGSPADILLNGRLIAHGEIVVVDQDYAVRVTQILDTSEDI